MNDEKKEILNKLLEYFKESNINVFGYEQDKLISYEEAQILLDYITNLQQYYYDNVNKYEELIEKYSNLQKENQILKENAIHNDKVVDKVRWNETIYKTRIDKTIEKLKSVRIYSLRSSKTLIFALINDALDILEGDDENGN